jgi:hypothetical protein
MKPVLPNTQQSSYPTSPQSFYTRSSDTPNSYLSGSNVSSPQTSYSNLNSPLSVDTNMASPASDFSSNIRSPILPFGLEKTLDVEMLMFVLQDFASAEISRNSMSNYSFL